MSNTIVRYSYHDLLTTPEDGDRHEIFEGDLIVTASPSYAHQNAVTNIVHILASHIKLHRLGKVLTAPLDIYLDEERVVDSNSSATRWRGYRNTGLWIRRSGTSRSRYRVKTGSPWRAHTKTTRSCNQNC